jgi:RNA recognition motif-containing protein
MASSSVDNIESPLSVANPSNEEEKISINNLVEQYRKLFIGGLSYTTTDEKLK